MRGPVVIDSNLAVLLIVGAASRSYIARHKHLSHYDAYDFELLGEIIKEFSDIVMLPHVLSETSNLVRQIAPPAYRAVKGAFRTFVEGAVELALVSRDGCDRPEFMPLGLADAMLLHVCGLDVAGAQPTLLTADSKLADCALSMGYSVIDYRREFMSD